MDLSDLIAIAWKRRLTIVIVIVAAVAAAAAIALTSTKQYESTATLVMTPNAANDQGIPGADALATLLPTYAEVVQSASTEAVAARLLGHPLGASISAATTAGTGILRISATSTSPTAAAQAATAVARAFSQSVATTSHLLIVQVVGPATVPTSPVAPRKTLILGAGLILGIALGIALALVLDRWFDRISTAQDITDATGLACLGHIPRNPALRGGGPNSLIWNDDPELFRIQEAIRALRTTLQLSMGSDSRVLQVTSPSPGDGKSTVAANLAVAIASVGVPTLIVDADFWAPRQHTIFGLSNSRGLSAVMAAGAEEARLPLQQTRFNDLAALTSGPLPTNPTELIAAGIESVLERLRGLDRVIVVDSPPVLAISDARIVAAQADLVVLVVSAEQTKASVLRLAVEQLQVAQNEIGGVVLNGVRKMPAAQRSYGGYDMRPERTVAIAGERPSGTRD